MDNLEKRVLTLNNDIQFRAVEEEDGRKFIEGYAAVFNSRSKLIMEMGELFYEEIERGAFADVLQEDGLDVYLTFNHSRDYVIARTVNDSLKLSEDDTGLWFRAEIPNVSYANDTYELVKNGTFFENSFAFAVDSDGFRWSETEDNIPLRIVNKIRRLVDVSVVTKGAYADTTVAARELQEYRDSADETASQTGNEEDVPNMDEQERMKMKIKF